MPWLVVSLPLCAVSAHARARIRSASQLASLKQAPQQRASSIKDILAKKLAIGAITWHEFQHMTEQDRIFYGPDTTESEA